jgi:hypothetical protein
MRGARDVASENNLVQILIRYNKSAALKLLRNSSGKSPMNVLEDLQRNGCRKPITASDSHSGAGLAQCETERG